VIQDSHTHYLAKACGITDEGYLILQKENGEISELMVGDILEKEE